MKGFVMLAALLTSALLTVPTVTQAETTAVTVLTTTAFVVTATGWLIVLAPAMVT